MNDKTIIFFSNPFGYGPTSKVLTVCDEIKKYWNGEIIIAGSGLVEEIVNKDKYNFVECDQRNEEDIKRVILQYKNPYIISSLNRFAVRVASQQNIPSVFIDGLTWMWKEIPQDYLLGDLYFCTNFPGIESKIKNINKAVQIDFILSELPTYKKEKDNVVIHVGGGENPIEASINTAYFSSLEYVVSKLNIKKKIYIVGGEKALNIFKKIKNENIIVGNFSKDHYINLISKSGHLITTSGLNGTYEAFFMKVPTSMMLPLNLSQWRFLEYLAKDKIIDSYLFWEDIFNINKININDMDEKEGLKLIENLSIEMYYSKKYLARYRSLFENLISDSPSTEKQFQFINMIGINGAKQLVQRLRKEWDF